MYDERNTGCALCKDTWERMIVHSEVIMIRFDSHLLILPVNVLKTYQHLWVKIDTGYACVCPRRVGKLLSLF